MPGPRRARPPAEACGGCFVADPESTQVNGHQMVLSLSNESTTLWDPITYSGNPADFAWVLPIKGVADIGLSSDIVFGVLDQNASNEGGGSGCAHGNGSSVPAVGFVAVALAALRVRCKKDKVTQ